MPNTIGALFVNWQRTVFVISLHYGQNLYTVFVAK